VIKSSKTMDYVRRYPVARGRLKFPQYPLAAARFLKQHCCRSGRLNESEIFNSNQSSQSHRQPKHSTKTLSYMQISLSFSLCSCCSFLDLIYFLVSAAFYPTLSGWISRKLPGKSWFDL